jgi:hypothetical protein
VGCRLSKCRGQHPPSLPTIKTTKPLSTQPPPPQNGAHWSTHAHGATAPGRLQVTDDSRHHNQRRTLLHFPSKRRVVPGAGGVRRPAIPIERLARAAISFISAADAAGAGGGAARGIAAAGGHYHKGPAGLFFLCRRRFARGFLLVFGEGEGVASRRVGGAVDAAPRRESARRSACAAQAPTQPPPAKSTHLQNNKSTRYRATRPHKARTTQGTRHTRHATTEGTRHTRHAPHKARDHTRHAPQPLTLEAGSRSLSGPLRPRRRRAKELARCSPSPSGDWRLLSQPTRARSLRPDARPPPLLREPLRRLHKGQAAAWLC